MNSQTGTTATSRSGQASLTRKAIYWYGDEGADDPRNTGGKSASFAILHKAGVPIPEGFTVATWVYQDLLERNELAGFIREQLATLDTANEHLLNIRSARIMQAVEAASLAPEIVEEIHAARIKLGNKPISGRSTADIEDGKDHSFAGQFKSFMFIEPEELIAAVTGVHASYWSANGVTYRERNGLNHMDGRMGVLNQVTLRSKKAGVMTVGNKTNGNPNQVYIECAWGQGEGVVQGIYTPDVYVLDLFTGQLVGEPRYYRKQKTMLDHVITTGEHGNIGTVEVPQSWVKKPKLNAAELRWLWEQANKIRAAFNSDLLDIEFSFVFPEEGMEDPEDGSNGFITQTRTLTSFRMADGTQVVERKETAPVLMRGIPGGVGIAYSQVQILDEAHLPDFRDGNILAMDNPQTSADPQMIRSNGILAKYGGVAAHVFLVAGEEGLPAIAGIGDAFKKLKTGMTITIDGVNGVVYKGEAKIVMERLKRQEAALERRARALRTRTRILCNTGSPKAAQAAAELYVEGVGLVRVEWTVLKGIKIAPQWFIKNNNEEMFIAMLVRDIGTICKAFAPRKVLVRAIDIRTDEYIDIEVGGDLIPREANPLAGEHGMGLTILHPELFWMEARAYAQLAKEHDNFELMLPFVRFDYELEEAHYMLKKAGLDTRDPKFNLAMMFENPANFVNIESFVAAGQRVGVKKWSYGGNDATQTVLAVDRTNALIRGMYSISNPTMLRYYSESLKVARANGIDTGFCGDGINRDRKLVRTLVEGGINSLSPLPGKAHEVRIMVAEIEADLLGVSVDEYQSKFDQYKVELDVRVATIR